MTQDWDTDKAMNDHDEQPTRPDDPQPEGNAPSDADIAPVSDEIDVEGALAAVASLHTLTQEEQKQEEQEEEDRRLAETEAEGAIEERHAAAAEHEPEAAAAAMPAQPAPLPTDHLLRGQAASVVPAFLLMGAGAVLIFLLTTDSALPAPPLLLAGVLLSLGIMLLSRWFSSRAPGSLFVGLLLSLFAGALFLIGQPTPPAWATGWPPLLIAPGLALFLGALAMPGERSASLPGAALIAAGVVSLLVNQLVPDWEPMIAQGWPVALVIGIVLLIAPVLRRRRN